MDSIGSQDIHSLVRSKTFRTLRTLYRPYRWWTISRPLRIPKYTRHLSEILGHQRITRRINDFWQPWKKNDQIWFSTFQNNFLTPGTEHLSHRRSEKCLRLPIGSASVLRPLPKSEMNSSDFWSKLEINRNNSECLSPHWFSISGMVQFAIYCFSKPKANAYFDGSRQCRRDRIHEMLGNPVLCLSSFSIFQLQSVRPSNLRSL
jgi:hypothetical protein